MGWQLTLTEMDTFIELLKLGSVGLIAGLFSSYLANRDYRQRKWWELKAAAYQTTIESLSDLVYYYDTQLSAILGYYTHTEEFKERLRSYWDTAFQKIRKSADSGAFLFSLEANTALREFIDSDDPDEPFPDHLENRLAGAKKCLINMIKYSKTDLKLRPSFFERFLG